MGRFCLLKAQASNKNVQHLLWNKFAIIKLENHFFLKHLWSTNTLHHMHTFCFINHIARSFSVTSRGQDTLWTSKNPHSLLAYIQHTFLPQTTQSLLNYETENRGMGINMSFHRSEYNLTRCLPSVTVLAGRDDWHKVHGWSTDEHLTCHWKEERRACAADLTGGSAWVWCENRYGQGLSLFNVKTTHPSFSYWVVLRGFLAGVWRWAGEAEADL